MKEVKTMSTLRSKVMVKAMLTKAPALAPTKKVLERETRGKRKLLQGSKGRRLRALKTPLQDKRKCQTKVFSRAHQKKNPRNTRGKIIGGGPEHSKNNLRGITYGIRLV